jgi:hypothetical protein
MKNFMGKDGFQWFIGVVEDRDDPKRLGRLKVRCLGHHTEDLVKLPTKDLPWAHPMNPITSATVSGIGQTPLGAVEGTWVVGFFTDGPTAQQPVVMGTLPGVPKNTPTKIEPTVDPKTGEEVYNGKGFQDYINGDYPKYVGESDVNRLAINETVEVPDTEAVGGGNQVVEFNGGDVNDEISKANRNSPIETIKVAQFQADLQDHLSKVEGFKSGSNASDMLKAATDFKNTYAKKFKLPANILESKENILTGAANHIDTIVTKTIGAVNGTEIGTMLKDSILVNSLGKLYTPGNLKDILPANLSVDAIASGLQNIKSFNIKDLATSSLDNFASLATDKIPGNLIKGDVVAGALKFFKSPLKKLSVSPHLTNVLDKANLTQNIGVAQIDGVAGEILGTSGLNTASTALGQIDADLDSLSGGAWSEPPSPYNAKYPFNHVHESESGHIKEIDDTEGAERIHERHMSGSSYEIGPEGTKVTKVVKDNYEIISNDDFLHVKGTRRQTVDEGVRIRCNAKAGFGNSYSIEVGVGANCNIEVNGGNVNISARGFGTGGGNINLNAVGNINMKAVGSINLAAGGRITEAATTRQSNILGLNDNKAGVFDITASQVTIKAPLGIFLN